MANLLRTQAQERARVLRPTLISVQLDLRGAQSFESVSTITFSAVPGAASFCDFAGSELVAAELNGRPLDAGAWSEGRIRLSGLQAENTLRVSGVMAYGNSGEGLNQHLDPADGRRYLYAMSFLDAAPRWFACFDQPDLKVPHQFEVRVPEEWVVLGNAPAEAVASGQWRIGPTQPLSSYFVTLAAGEWAGITARHQGLTLGLHTRTSLAEELAAAGDDLMEVTTACLDAYQEIFEIPYPFGDYHQVFVPDFNAGAMENPGCVVFRDSYLHRGTSTAEERARRASTVAHEMAHQWFGDLVTMRWWDDLWLNESFAEYMGHRITEQATRHRVWTSFGITRKDWGSQADQGPSSHPVAGNGAADAHSALGNFDGISYAKGAALLRQLAELMGDQIFLTGLNDYFARHAFGNASLADLLDAWRRAGATGLTGWAAQWLETAGQDVLVAEPGAGRPAATGGPQQGWQLTRRTPPTGAGPQADRIHRISCALLDASGTELARTSCLLGGQPVRLELPSPAGSVLVPDAGDQTWARIRPGGPWTQLPISAVADPATRVVLYNALRDAVRNTELAPQVALELLTRVLPSEPDAVMLREMLAFSLQLSGQWLAPQARRQARALLARCTREVIGSATDPDRRRVAFRVLVDCCDDLDQLNVWLAGGPSPLQSELDPDLRWQLVLRAMVLDADPVLIEAELVRDPSTTGHDFAAAARAARPDATAKIEALQAILRPSQRRGQELLAIGGQLFRPEQDELTAALALEYLEGIAGTAAFRHGWTLSSIATAAFPFSHATPELLAKAHELLELADTDPHLLRGLRDATHRFGQLVAARQFAAEPTR